MGNLIKAAEDIRTLASRFQSILEVAASLERIGSLEQAEREAKQRTDKAVSDTTRAHGEIEKLGTQVQEAKDGLQCVHDAAIGVEADGKAKSATLIEAGNVEAARLVKEGNDEKTRILVGLETAQNNLTSLNEDVTAKQTEFDQLTTKLNDLKGDLKRLIGE